jgi:hypothetical protein
VARQQIDDGLALAIAGQVSVGIMPGEKQAERSHMALVVIGMMVKNAAKSATVDDALALGQRARVQQSAAGGWEVEEQTMIKSPEPRKQ